MPLEKRILVFKSEEVSSALRDFAKQQGRTMGEGAITHVRYNQQSDEGVKITLCFSKGERKVEFTDLETAAALLAYLKKTGIPIPRRGKKALYVRHDDLAMQIDVPNNNA